MTCKNGSIPFRGVNFRYYRITFWHCQSALVPYPVALTEFSLGGSPTVTREGWAAANGFAAWYDGNLATHNAATVQGEGRFILDYGSPFEADKLTLQAVDGAGLVSNDCPYPRHVKVEGSDDLVEWVIVNDWQCRLPWSGDLTETLEVFLEARACVLVPGDNIDFDYNHNDRTLTINGGETGISDAPVDDQQYIRINASWAPLLEANTFMTVPALADPVVETHLVGAGVGAANGTFSLPVAPTVGNWLIAIVAINHQSEPVAAAGWTKIGGVGDIATYVGTGIFVTRVTSPGATITPTNNASADNAIVFELSHLKLGSPANHTDFLSSVTSVNYTAMPNYSIAAPGAYALGAVISRGASGVTWPAGWTEDEDGVPGYRWMSAAHRLHEGASGGNVWSPTISSAGATTQHLIILNKLPAAQSYPVIIPLIKPSDAGKTLRFGTGGQSLEVGAFLPRPSSNHADDAAAAVAGILVGECYHTNGVVKIRLT